MNDAQLAHVETCGRRPRRKLLRSVLQPTVAKAPSKLALRTTGATSLLAEPDPDISWLVDDLLPATGVVVAAGDPKSFKTLLALQLAVTVGYAPEEPLYERDFLGRTARPGTVLFVEEEGSRHKLRERIRMMSDGLGWPREFSIEFALHQGVRLDERKWLEDIYRHAEHHETSLIVLDPLVMLHSGATRTRRASWAA